MVEEAVSPVSKPTVGNKCDVDFDIPDINLPEDLKDLKAKLTRPTGKVCERKLSLVLFATMLLTY